MKLRHQLFILLIFFGTSIYLFYAGYDTVKEEMIRDLNLRQTAHAKQAAKGIANLFDHYLSDLKFLSQIDAIIEMNDEGRSLMQTYYNNNSKEIHGVTRVDASGRIVSTYPFDHPSIGVDISFQDHIRQIMKTHAPVVSDVFEAVQGFRCIAFHVPVFRAESYDGSICVLIRFDHISEQFLEDIRIGRDGYAWLLSSKGVELYCPVPGHIGRTVYETSKQFPSVLSMADEMTQGKSGETTYTYDRIRGDTVVSIKKQAVYLPIPVINTFWSIVIATPENEALDTMVEFNRTWMQIILLTLSGFMLFAYSLMKAREMVQEQRERIQSEEALISANRHLNDIIDFLPDATLVLDKDKKIVAWNRAMEEMTGVSKENMIGKSGYAQTVPFYGEPRPHLLDLLYAHDEELESRYHNVKRRGSSIYAEAFAHALYDGKGAYIWTIGAPLFDIHGNLSGAIESIRDITEIKIAEKALKASEEKYRELVENVNSIIFRRDPAGTIRFFNEFAQKFFGYDEAEIIGRNVVGTIVPETESTGRNLKWLIEDIGRNPDRYTNNINENMRRNGDRVWIAWTNKPVYDENRQIKEILCIGNDITARMQMEEERRKLEIRLNRAEKMESLGTLAGGVAHDMNNVLGVLVGYSELLMEEIPESSPLRKFVENILLSGMRGAAIIQDLLTLTRRGVAVSKVMNLNRVLSDFFKTPDFEKLKASHSGVTFHIHLEKNLLNIMGSPVHLEKTIMNLVSNAAESVCGTGEVTIQTLNQYLDSPILGYDEVQDGDYVVLKVSDTGEGIPSKDIGKIFEPFYTKKVMGKSGTGLGLAVVWGTVKDHKGYINVQSEEGGGSVFTLYFPISREDLPEDRKSVSLDEFRGRGESILVVDDVKEQRELAHDMLARLGYQVKALPSGEAALEYLERNTADMIVLDMIMSPGMDGLETYRRILERNPHQKAIIVSGYSETDRVKQTLGLGAGAYVQKPYVMEIIGLSIRKQLDS